MHAYLDLLSFGADLFVPCAIPAHGITLRLLLVRRHINENVAASTCIGCHSYSMKKFLLRSIRTAPC